jgi:hypothetical protein
MPPSRASDDTASGARVEILISRPLAGETSHPRPREPISLRVPLYFFENVF